MRQRLVRRLALAYRARGLRRTRDDVESTLAAARATIGRRSYCVLVTHDEVEMDGRVVQRARRPDESLTLWFGTTPTSRKVAQIRADPSVTVIFLDDSRTAGVTLRGSIEIVEDPAERRRHFRSSWWAFFPDGPEGDDFVALRFVPTAVQVWDGRRGVTPPPFGLASSRLVRENGGWARG